MGRQDYETETLLAQIHEATHDVAGTMMSYAKSGGDSNRIDNAAGGYMCITHALRGEGFDASEDGTGRGTPLVPVAFTTEQTPKHNGDCALTLTKQSPTGGGQIQSVAVGSAVRRLTPRECERLQGFPDDYTLVPHRGNPMADGPRYKALGNSMAVPVMRWIGERIAAVDALTSETLAA